VRVSASASKGTAVSLGCDPATEDTISLLVHWANKHDPEKRATAVYTASWTAPQKAGVRLFFFPFSKTLKISTALAVALVLYNTNIFTE